MGHSLLSHIAGNFISQYENVANSSVAYLLTHYPAAQRALARMLDLQELPPRFVTEEHTKNGRPDVVGRNNSGDIAVIIEGKFWASLTDNQPANYLRELKKTGGPLLFLAPGRRLDSLNQELQRRIEAAADLTECRWRARSWADFIDAIDNENDQERDTELRSDLNQLRALCERMDVEGMPPVTASDLDPMHGRIAFQFADLINECWHRLRNWEPTDFGGVRASANQDSYGFNFYVGEFGCRLLYSSKLWFVAPVGTPFWLVVTKKDGSRCEQTLTTLAQLGGEYFVDSEAITGLGLPLRPGMTRDEAIAALVEQVQAALHAVTNDQSS